MRLHNSLKYVLLIVLLAATIAKAQDTNPVERQVANPLTDTPNINPVAPEQDIKAPKKKPETGSQTLGGAGRLFIDSNKVSSEGEEGNRVIVHEGNVDAHYGVYRLQADKRISRKSFPQRFVLPAQCY
jgi:lipopolysaccharide assembly outer membrane protein LptD (OstA)